jgi:uncharacterized membrane protein required for colicin V production
LKVFDLLVLLALLITAYSGFKNGFIQTIFKTIGYVSGGVAGVAIAVEVMSTWSNNLAKAAGAIMLVLSLAIAGEFILGKVGLGFRKVLFISLLKLLDSLLGAGLATLRTVFIFYLISVILIASPWSIGDSYIISSQFYKIIDFYSPNLVSHLNSSFNDLFE